jgi:biotin carboxyl carrier protein
MEMTVTIDNVERRIDVTQDGEGYVVSIGEATYRVSDVNSIEGTISFLLDRQSFMAHVSDGEGGVRISIRGRNYRLIEESMDADRPGGQALGGDGRIEAPMPGTIVAVHVAEGDTVSTGQPLMVLESMKMQNEITAPVDGVVKHLGCGQGEQVGFGAILVEIEPAGDE